MSSRDYYYGGRNEPVYDAHGLDDYDDEDRRYYTTTAAPSVTNNTTTVVTQPSSQENKPGFIRRTARFVGLSYMVLCTAIITFMLLAWHCWMFKFTLFVERSQSTNRTRGFMFVAGGMTPLLGPPSTILRVGRGVDTPLVYDRNDAAEFKQKHSFIALSRRPREQVAAYDLGAREGVRFVGDPSSNGDVGLAPLDYRFMTMFNYNAPTLPILPVTPIPEGGGGGEVSIIAPYSFM